MQKLRVLQVLNPCDYCLFGKHHRVSFHTSSKKKNNLLELTYFDVCGLVEVESFSGNKYYLTLKMLNVKCGCIF